MNLMIKNIKLHFRAIAAGLLLFIFGLYYANITLSHHCHIINGVCIVHSHFYGSNHAQNPNDTANSTAHSQNTLTLIHALDNYVTDTPIETICQSATYIDIYSIEFVYKTIITPLNEFNQTLLRGPPASNSIS